MHTYGTVLWNVIIQSELGRVYSVKSSKKYPGYGHDQVVTIVFLLLSRVSELKHGS